MTEREYIDATNLAKIRAAKAILRDVLPMTSMDELRLKRTFRELVVMEEALAFDCKTEG